MNDTELKPCPFCGGEAKIVKYCGKKTIVYVECTNCLAYMGNQRIMTSSNRGKEYFESEEKLINAWNTRKPMDNIVEELEEMIRPKQLYFCKYVKGGCKHLDNDAKDCMECIVEQAINIVKAGGVE